MTIPIAANTTPSMNAWRYAMDTDDVEAHMMCQPGWQLNYEQLSAGKFHGQIDHIHLPGMSLIWEGSNQGMRQSGQMARCGYGFGVPISVGNKAFFSGQRLDPASVMLGPSDDLDLCSQEPLMMVGMIVDAELVRTYCELLLGHFSPAWLQRPLVLSDQPDLTVGLLASLRSAFDILTTASSAMNDPAACLQFRDELLLQCMRFVPEQAGSAEPKSHSARRKMVRRACDFIYEHGQQPISLFELCSKLGASERKLNYCFQEILGMSPGRYLRIVRLNGARRALRHPDNVNIGVQDVAARWGFWHLGQFSADYKRQFHELPSETLHRTRNSVGV